MIPYLTIALAVCSLFAIGYMNFVRPARRRRRAAMEIAPPEPRPNFAPNKPTGVTPPDGRVPRDLDRPYPRPAGGRRKPDKTCPVCGTGAETTPLDGKVLGWRAHGSCAEWLGEWRPQRPVPLPYSPDKSLIGYIEQGQKSADPGPIQVGPMLRRETGSTNTIHYAGNTAGAVDRSGGAGGSGGVTITPHMLMNGLISLDEARERLTRPVAGQGTITVGALDGAPSFRWRCACGVTAFGTAPTEELARNYANRDLAAHAGECPLTPF